MRASCEGGEGPRHKKAKNWILDMCSKDSKVTYCAEEIRIGRKYADVFIQTDLGPFYIEVIDSHPPESTRWEELEHRIIPFWIDRFREQDADGFEFMVHHDFGEIFLLFCRK